MVIPTTFFEMRDMRIVHGLSGFQQRLSSNAAGKSLNKPSRVGTEVLHPQRFEKRLWIRTLALVTERERKIDSLSLAWAQYKRVVGKVTRYRRGYHHVQSQSRGDELQTRPRVVKGNLNAKLHRLQWQVHGQVPKVNAWRSSIVRRQISG